MSQIAKALCEASKWIFFLRYESGPVYRPSCRDNVAPTLVEIDPEAVIRLRSIWTYWEEGAVANDVTAGEEDEEAAEEEGEA